MAIFGSNINPALGRVDYSPIAQGMAMGGQLSAQGIANMGQGIANMGQNFAKVTEMYAQNREKNALLEGRNAALLRQFQNDASLRQFAPDPKSLDGLMAKMSKGGGLTLNDNIKLNAELQTTVDAAERAREAQLKQLYAEQARASVNKMTDELNRARQTDEAWGRWSELSRGFTKDTPYDEKLQAVARAGLPPEAASRAIGNVINAEQLGLARQRAAMEDRLADQKLKEDAANSDFLKRVREGTEKGFEISVDANGREILTDRVRGISTQIDTGKPPPATQGEKIAAYAKAFQQAEKDGNTLEQDKQIENLRFALGDAGKLEAREELASRLRDFGKGALLVKGKPKPVSAEPAPSAQDRQATQPANPTPTSTQTSTQTPTPAPTQAPEGRPATPPPVQNILSDEELALMRAAQAGRPAATPPVQDIILDDAFVRRPGVSGSFNVKRNSLSPFRGAPEISDYEFGARGYGYVPEPGGKLPSSASFGVMERMNTELKLSKARLELLEPKAKDSADTIALKKVIPYLPNRGLSQKLLKELSDGKQLSASSLKGDPFARSLLAAAKEGRLSQLNMAAIGGS